METNKALSEIEKSKDQVVETLSNHWAEIIALMPKLVGAFIILLIGLVVAYSIKHISISLFRRMGLDRISTKAGVSDVMQDAGLVRRPSKLAGQIIFWMVLLIFMVPAANTLGLTELVNLVKGFISFLPRMIAALVIVIFGMMFAQFLRRSIIEKPSTIGSNSAKTLGNLVYGIMVTVIILVAVEQLNIATVLLRNIIMLVVAGMMLALALSIGLGTRDVAHHLLAGIYAREQFKPGDHIEMDEMSGEIQEVSTLNTLVLLDDQTTLSIPNATLYNTLVKIHGNNDEA